ncbi:hypothetical protein I4U23_012547 [Adineta vaga]|nr:hypothetical protein I4U23_012547 [Adineta vaga]
MSAQSPSGSSDEYLNEQFINCLNIQNNVLHSLTQYSQIIRFQLGDIKSNVESLANRVVTIQQQQQQLNQQQLQQSYFTPPIQIYMPPPITNPSLFFQPPFPSSTFTNRSDLSPPSQFPFSINTNELPSRSAPFVFDVINSSVTIHPSNEDDEEYESYEPSVIYKPIVHLSPVETRTGEEDEDILFCERAKLYRFDMSTNEMKERGIGEMKILQHKQTHLCRVLMRREQVLKVCANHRITSQMELKEHNGKENAYIWSAVDYSDGTAKHETLCVRFKTDDQAKRFVKIFNEAKSINGKQTVDFLSIDKMRLSDEDVTIISEVKPTKEQIDRAKHLQLPSTFYLYENKEPCEGCRGCKEDSPSILSNEVQFEDPLTPYQTAALLEQLRNLPSGFFPNSSLPTLMSLVPTWFPESPDSFPTLNMPSPPRDRRMIIKPPPTTSSSPHSIHEQISSGIEEVAVVQTHQKKSRNFSGNIMQSYSLDNFASQLTKNIIEQVKQELVQQSEIVTTKEDTTLKSHSNNNNPSIFTDSSSSILENLVPVKSVSAGFSFANFDLSTKASTNTFQFSSSNPSTTTNTTPLFTFGNVPKVSFAQIAQQSSNNQWTSQDSDQRVFSGERTLLFDTQAKEDQDDDNDNDAYESYEPSVTYKPIVHLSPVETRTGEEDEDILFCERAKLYRFDMSTNEMKERGIGEMKILQHKQTHLCRVLMRREQVLKVCANHRITSQMELKEHNGKENAYIWSAVDYSDGTAKRETLL